MKKINYLVTGGAGFIGSNLVEKLLQLNNARVHIFDNFSTGKMENIKEFQDRIILHRGDLRYFPDVLSATKGMDFVFHQAALPSVPRSIKDPISTNDCNITGTLHLLEASKQNGVKRVIFASSSSVYGVKHEAEKFEFMEPDPISPYAFSKLAGEHYCKLYHELYGLETVCLRYFNVFGKKQNPNSQYSAVIPIFIKNILLNNPITIFGDGMQTRDFTHVDNVVNANLLASNTANISGKVFNVACGEFVKLKHLVWSLFDKLGIEVEIKHKVPRLGDIRHSYANIDLIGSWMGYSPVKTLEQGLSETVDYFMSKT